MSEAIRKRLAHDIDRQMMQSFGLVTSSNIAEPHPALTLDTLLKLALSVPKKETWVSTKRFPHGPSIRVEASGENFLVANPSFWMKVQHETTRAQTYKPFELGANQFMPFAGIPIIEIDFDDDDSEDRRRYLADIWVRLFDAVSVACVELPDWLKGAPKFTKHG